MARFLPRGPLKFRFEPDTGLVWIPSTAFRGHLTDRQIDVRSAMSDLAAAGYAVAAGSTMKRIAAGALEGLDSSAVRCYQFHAARIGVDEDAFKETPPNTAATSAEPGKE